MNTIEAARDYLSLFEATWQNDKALVLLHELLGQESPFHPDWSLLDATRSSLREYMALLRGQQMRIAELEAAITKTLNKNGHLADGDVCTLIDLKRAMPTWELE